MAAATTLRLLIRGRVQGVGFRYAFADEARARSLRGWVRNRHDSSVEAVLIGDDDAIEAVAAACARGPRLAKVTGIERTPAEDDGSTGFRELPTM